MVVNDIKVSLVYKKLIYNAKIRGFLNLLCLMLLHKIILFFFQFFFNILVVGM